MNPSRFTRQQVLAFRLQRQHLLNPGNADLASICRDTAGVQAQVPSAARLALRVRRSQLEQNEIDDALHRQRTLVKTSCMRQTLHLIAATDFSVYITALKRSRAAALFKIANKFGVTAREYDKLITLVAAAAAGEQLTQKELMQRVLPELSPKFHDWLERAWSGMGVRPAIIEGLLCYGPERGREATLVRVDEWLPPQSPLPEAQAKQEMLRRYLRALGPASQTDFARWMGMPAAEARAVWRDCAEELATVSVDGQAMALLRDDLDALAAQEPAPDSLRLLPQFDSYLLSHVDKSVIVPEKHYKKVYRQAGWVWSVVLQAGQVVGIWTQSRRSGAVRIEVELFASVPAAARRRLEREAASLAAFQDAELELAVEEA